MESIQQQISTLAHKVDAIYQILERLDRDVFNLGEKQSHRGNSDNFDRLFNGHNDHHNGNDNGNGNGHDRHSEREWIIAQQDTLIDSTGLEINYHKIESPDLSPQVQIQRLTAQLTAAYNRIAALEEQLLSKRWHS
jgi:hypothetical protein